VRGNNSPPPYSSPLKGEETRLELIFPLKGKEIRNNLIFPSKRRKKRILNPSIKGKK